MHFASQEWRFFWKRREAYRHLVNGITFTIWFIFVNGWKVCSSKPMQNFFSLHQSTKKYPLFSLQAFVFQLIDELNQLSPDPPPSLPRQSSVADRRCITLQIPVYGPMLTSAKSSLCVIYFPLYMYNVSPGNGPLTIVKCKIRLATTALSRSFSIPFKPAKSDRNNI